ncbi:SDR family NAD(P)-dependent oxidoreductase [Kitasatospora sp. NPDC059571]|uniref:SDR family NAD(P)-dependent oxidoreductase n=1 Tax=Kitasatospora sp. NPDC059571 TaxID=3346871 RepID=UPI0036B912D8
MNPSTARILVTGGTSGVGRALVTALTGLGATVASCGRSAADTPADGGGPISLTADLAVPGEAARVVARAAERLGGLDAIVANAGVQYAIPLTGGPDGDLLDRIRREFAVNLTSVAELAAAGWPYLAARPAASFVAVTSGLAYAPKRTAPVYCAAKAGLHTLLDALRYQAEDTTPQVKVQEIVLPLVDTAMTAGREGPARKIPAEAAAAAIVAALRNGRAVTPVGAARSLLAVNRVSPPAARRIMRNA